MKQETLIGKRSATLRTSALLMIPFILLYGIYIQINGENSPGGGFQAGVIVAAAMILHSLVFDVKNTEKIITPLFVKKTLVGGVLIYISVGLLNIMLGGNFLEYATVSADFSSAQKICIFTIEIGVGITVCAAMLIFHTTFINYKEQFTKHKGKS